MNETSKVAGRLSHILKWQYVASAVQGVLGALYMILLARVLGVAEFGVFSLVTALITSSSLFCEARMQEVVVKKFHVLGEDRQTHMIEPDFRIRLYDYFLFESLTRLAPALLLAALTPVILSYYNHESVSSSLIYIACIGFVFSKSGNGSAIGLLRVMDHANLIALGTTVDWGLRLLLSAALAMTGLLSVKLALCISFLVPTAMNFWYIFTARRLFNAQIQIQGDPRWSIRGFATRMTGDIRLIAAQIGLSVSDLMAKDLDILILSLTMSLESIGLYRAAKYLVQILWRAVDPFYLALLPEVQRLWAAKKYPELKFMLIRISKQLFLGAIILIAAMWLGLWLFSDIFFGKGYEGLPNLAPQMSLWLLVCAPLIWGGTLAFAIGHPEITLVGSLIGSITGVILFFSLVPILALTGAAIAWSSTLAIGFAFTALVSVRVARRKIKSSNQNMVADQP